MKKVIASAVFVIAAGLAVPALAQMRGGGPPQEDFGPTPHAAPDPDEAGPVSRDAISLAQDMRLRGKCNEAVPILRRIADHGPGFEISQVDLGLCLLDLAPQEHDTQAAQAMRKEGAEWILRAANAGFAKAQAKAVVLYLDATGVAADPVEAEKWALIYHGNAMRYSIGLPDIAPDIAGRLDAALSDATRAEAQTRADSFTPNAAAADE